MWLLQYGIACNEFPVLENVVIYFGYSRAFGYSFSINVDTDKRVYEAIPHSIILALDKE